MLRRNMIRALWVMLFLVYMSGCAFIKVQSLIPSISQLEERTVGGEGDKKILLLDVSGVISEKEQTNALGMVTELSPIARIHEELERARKDEKIKAVLLKINSPGGTVTASDIIYHELTSFKQEKGIPIVVSLMDLATSGGYYIALAGDVITAHPTTITGSIGVLLMKFDVQGLMEKIGVEEVTMKSGDKKNILSIFHKLRPEDQAILQGIIDGLFKRFIDTIAEARKGISRPEIEGMADGRIYSAQQALELKLIDKIGYLEDSIELAKKEAGLERARIIVYQRPSQYKSTVYAQSSQAAPGSYSQLFPVTKNISPQFWYLWNP
ncbi:MAG: signal peptide peptidase SppA [bacterium]